MSEIKSRIIVEYSDLTPELWDFLEGQGEIALILSQVHELVLQVPPESADNIRDVIAARPDVAAARFDRRSTVKLCGDPVQSLYGGDKILDAVRAKEAWEIQMGRPDVVLAFTDSGMDEAHPDLHAAVIPRQWSYLEVEGLAYTTAGTSYPKRVDLQTAGTYFIGSTNSTSAWYFYSALDGPQSAHVPALVYLDVDCTQLAPRPVVQGTNRYVWITHPTSAGVLTGANQRWIPCLDGGVVRDTYGHGTSTTGVSVAQHNGKGVMGIAPGCKVIMYNGIEGQYLSTVKYALIAMANLENVAVHNASWANVDAQGVPQDDTDIRAGFEYIRTKTDGLGNNLEIVCVSAAGNDAKNSPTKWPVGYPGSYPEVITVGGTAPGRSGGKYNETIFFSNRSDCVHISAPAGGYATTAPLGPDNFDFGWDDFTTTEDLPEFDYSRYSTSGTSYASPLVTGVIGLMKSEAKDLGIPLTRAQVAAILKDSANPWILNSFGKVAYDTSTLGPLGKPIDGMGWGLVDACRALRAVRSEIDVRFQRIYSTEASAGVSATLCVLDVKTWGTGIQKIEVYISGVLVSTLTPGGTSYVADLSLTFPQAGLATEIYCVATDLNGSVSTSASAYIDVYPAAQPLVEATRFPNPDIGDQAIGYIVRASSAVEDTADHPVLINDGGSIQARLYTPTGAPALVFTALKFYINEVLVGNFTPSATATQSRQATYTLNMASVTPGFGTLRVEATAGGVTFSRSYSCIYAGTGTAARIFTKPFTYQNGVLTFDLYARADQSQNVDSYVGCLRAWALKLDGVRFATDIGFNWQAEVYHRFQAQVPLPSVVEVEINCDVADRGWNGYWFGYNGDVDNFNNITTISATIPAAEGNDPSTDSTPPVSYATRASGKYAPGTTVALGEFCDNPVTIKYRWVP